MNSSNQSKDKSGSTNQSSLNKTGKSSNDKSGATGESSKITSMSKTKSVAEQSVRREQSSKQMPNDMDLVTKNLNKLCRLTPEGYMIMIEQRQFEGRDQTQVNTAAEKASNTLKMQSLSKEVEKIF